MSVTQNLNQARSEMLYDEKLSLCLGLDKLTTEKVKYAAIFFLEQANKENFRVYKTHLLNFFSLSELYYAKEHSNVLFEIQYQVLKEGLVPMTVYRAVDFFDSVSLSKEEIVAKELLPFTAKKFLNGMRIFLKKNCQFSNYYFSVFDLIAMKKAANKIIKLKTVDKISDGQ